MKDILLLIGVWPFLKTFLAPVSLFWAVNKFVFDGQLSKWLITGIEKTWQNSPNWMQKIRADYVSHYKLMEEHNSLEKPSGWFSNRVILSVFVLLAANMYIFAGTFFSLTILSIFREQSVLKILIGLMCVVFFWKMARYYKADAYNLAYRYRVNLFPWNESET